MESNLKHLFDSCSNCCSDINKNSISSTGTHLKIEGKIGDDSALDVSILEVLAYIVDTTNEDFKCHLMNSLTLEHHYDRQILWNSLAFELAICDACGSVLKEMYFLRRKLKDLSKENSILWKASEFSKACNSVKQEKVTDDDTFEEFSSFQDFSCNDANNKISRLKTENTANDCFESENMAVCEEKTIYKSGVPNKDIVSVKLHRLPKSQVNSRNHCNRVRGKRRLSKRQATNKIKELIKEKATTINCVKVKVEKLSDSDVDPNFQSDAKKIQEKKVQKRHHRNFQCGKCSRTFTIKRHLDAHQIVHSETYVPRRKGPVKCPMCPKVLKNYESYKYRHIRTHQNRTFPCDVCGKLLRTRSFLKRHKSVMHGDKPPEKTVCPVCGKLVRHLPSHMTLHSENRISFPCDKCEKVYMTKMALSEHANVHANEKVYCQFCGKAFWNKYSLIAHEKNVHTEEKPISCDKCDKHFKTSWSYTAHLKCHTDARPFKCDQCGKDFKRSNHYRTHLRNHEDEKQGITFVCEICGKNLKNRKSLLEHSNLHKEDSDKKKANCSLCGKTLSSNSVLKTHMKGVHKVHFD